MNFARFCWLNASKFPNREFLIESYPSKKMRRALTWKELNEQTNKVANYLIKECGIKKGDVVQHLMMNSIEWYVTYMAVLKAGAVISPLNFRFASGDIKYACDVTKSKVFILGDGFVPRVEPIMKEMGYVKQYICVGDNVPASMKSYKEIMEKGDATNILVETKDDDMAELMFTSGTTGAPKPVCHTHETLFYIGIGNALTYNEGYIERLPRPTSLLPQRHALPLLPLLHCRRKDPDGHGDSARILPEEPCRREMHGRLEHGAHVVGCAQRDQIGRGQSQGLRPLGPQAYRDRRPAGAVCAPRRFQEDFPEPAHRQHLRHH